MKTMRLIGNIVAVASGVAAALLALWGVKELVYADRAFALAAVGICVAWFGSLALRSIAKEKPHA